jgi:hypothetical protein
MIEIWKDIQGYEGLYQVSSLGRIRSNKGIRKQSVSNRGYMLVGLCRYNVPKTYLVHRIVAKAFIANVQNKPEINHIDGNKQNNSIKNLEWVSRKENEQHSFHVLNHPMPIVTQKYKGKYGKEHNRSRVVLQYSQNGEYIRQWDSLMDIERQLGIPHGNVSHCCAGKVHSAGNFIFKYKQ